MLSLFFQEFKKYSHYINNIIGIGLLVMFMTLSYLGMSFHNICYPITFLIFLIDMYLCRKKQAMLFINFYLFIYFLYLYYYFYLGAQLSIRTQYHLPQYFENTCLLFYIFYFSQFLVFSQKKKQKCTSAIIRNNKISLTHTEQSLLIIMSILLLMKTMTIGTDLIRNGFSYQAYIKNLESSSVIPMLFIVVLSVYAFSEKSNKFVCFVFSIFYIYFCVSRGFRITAIPGLLVFFISFMEGKINNRLFILGIIISAIMVLVIGEIKDTGSFKIENLLTVKSNNDKVIISHHSDLLYTVCCVFGVVKNKMIDGVQRITLGISFFLQSIILPSVFPDDLRFPLAVFRKAPNGGGGLFLAGAYLFWGYAGTFIFSLVLNNFLFTSYSTKSKIKRFIAAVVFVFSCNWISYDFHTILRFPLYAFILYWFLIHFNWRYLK